MCWKCGNNIELEFVSRSSECSFCHASLHSCKNCLYFSPGSHYDCHETVDELVADKEKANYVSILKFVKLFPVFLMQIKKLKMQKNYWRLYFHDVQNG